MAEEVDYSSLPYCEFRRVGESDFSVKFRPVRDMILDCEYSHIKISHRDGVKINKIKILKYEILVGNKYVYRDNDRNTVYDNQIIPLPFTKFIPLFRMDQVMITIEIEIDANIEMYDLNAYMNCKMINGFELQQKYQGEQKIILFDI